MEAKKGFVELVRKAGRDYVSVNIPAACANEIIKNSETENKDGKILVHGDIEGWFNSKDFKA